MSDANNDYILMYLLDGQRRTQKFHFVHNSELFMTQFRCANNALRIVKEANAYKKVPLSARVV